MYISPFLVKCIQCYMTCCYPCFQFAGAAQSLGAGAIIVNPWNVAEVAKSIKCALDMPANEREKRHRDNYKLVSTHSAQDWAEDFIW